MAEIPSQITLPTAPPRIDAPDVMQQIQPKAGAGMPEIGQAARGGGKLVVTVPCA